MDVSCRGSINPWLLSEIDSYTTVVAESEMNAFMIKASPFRVLVASIVRSDLLALCLVMYLCVQSVTAVAQSNNRERSNNTEPPQQEISLNLDNVDIRVLINTIAEVTGKNFIIDPRVNAKVSVVSGATLSPQQLYEVFLSILEVHRIATVESDDVIKVLPINDVKQRPIPNLSDGAIRASDEQISHILQLTHTDVQSLVPILRPLIPPTGHFAPHAGSNSIVLTDTAANILRIRRIIENLDVPDVRDNVRIIYLDHARASDLAQTLNEILSGAGATGSPGGAPGNNVSIIAHDSVNALIVTANEEEYARVQALVDELDIERSLESGTTVVFLKHANAADLVTVLNDLEGSGNAGTEGGIAGGSTVQADEATNSLIVKAAGAKKDEILSVINTLDRRRAQVYVEVVIAEVSLDQTAALGINWGAGGVITDDDGNSTGNLVDPSNSERVIGTGEIGTNFALQTGGLTASLLDFRKYNLDVIVNAIRTDSNSDVLSTPTILTLDNEEAEIVVGQEVPFITSSVSLGVDAGAADNRFTTNIERQNVGIQLRITPQISEGETIRLEIYQEISSVSPTTLSTGAADIVTDIRSIEAVVQADDGQVVVLGGLIQDNVTDTVSSVPILGSLPVVGHLFRSTQKEADKQNLMVFLKPQIIREPEDAKEFSKKRYEDLRQDSIRRQKESSNFLIENSKPPVLEPYEEVVGKGDLITRKRKKAREQAQDKAEKGSQRGFILLRPFRKKSSEIERDAELNRVPDSHTGEVLEGLPTPTDAEPEAE